MTVYERNRRDDTFGFGVVFSDETLDNIQDYDPEILRRDHPRLRLLGRDRYPLARRDRPLGRHGFCGIERKHAADDPAGARARARRRAEISRPRFTDLDRFADADLIVAADGINSGIRARFRAFPAELRLAPQQVRLGRHHQILPGLHLRFSRERTASGSSAPTNTSAGMSTLVLECDEATWLPAGARQGRRGADGRISGEACGRICWRAIRLLANRSIWRNFPMIKNERWYYTTTSS